MAEGRIAKWARYRKDAIRMGFYKKRAGYILLLNVAMIILVGALVVFLFERGRNPNMHNYFDSIYMIIITVATVGYGDIVPITTGGRITVILILVLGIGTLSAFITLLATRRAEKARRRYSGLLDKFKGKNHMVVCGWNTLGEYVMVRLKDELQSERVEVILLCELEQSPIDDDFTFFFRGDPTSMEALERVNVAEAKSAILLADESKGGSGGDIDARTVLTALNIKNLNPDIEITAEALRPENIHNMQLAGIREILDVTKFTGNLIARSALHFGLISTVSDMVTRDPGSNVYTIRASAEMAGKTRHDLASELDERFGYCLLAVISKESSEPGGREYRVMEGDNVLVLSEKKPTETVEDL